MPCLTDNKALARLATSVHTHTSTGSCLRWILDSTSGLKTGLREDFIDREMGIGKLKEVCEGASPRSLAEPRDDSYTKVMPQRAFSSADPP